LVPRERDRVEYAGVPEGVLVYGGAAHGAGERLPGLVARLNIQMSNPASGMGDLFRVCQLPVVIEEARCYYRVVGFAMMA